MRSRALSCVVGGVMVVGAWLTGACGSSFTAGAPETAGSAGQAAVGAGRSSGGATSGASGAHTGKAGGGSGGEASGESTGGTAGAVAGGGSPPAQGGSAGLNVAGIGGVGVAGGGASGAGAGGGGASGAGASGAGAGGGGASGAGAGGGGASGGGAGGAGAGGGGAGGATGCLASTSTWTGCQLPACGACSANVLPSYPLYFKNHPSCTPIASCPNALTACGAACPAPSSADVCDGTSGQWSGCRGSGCYVCQEKVANYPKYFANHPGCIKNADCMGQYFTCNANCPAPAAADM